MPVYKVRESEKCAGVDVAPRVANPPGMGGRLPEFKSISRPEFAENANLPEFRRQECKKMCLILVVTMQLIVHGLIRL